MPPLRQQLRGAAPAALRLRLPLGRRGRRRTGAGGDGGAGRVPAGASWPGDPRPTPGSMARRLAPLIPGGPGLPHHGGAVTVVPPEVTWDDSPGYHPTAGSLGMSSANGARDFRVQDKHFPGQETR